MASTAPEKTVRYGYDDPNWKDKLTSYNDDQVNHEIIYDGIGNPVVYRDGWKFEWTRGRSLEKALNSCYNINYNYDGAGIRTCKTVNSATTEFVTSGIQVLEKKTGDDVITWQIDGNSAVVGFNRGGTQYFYLKNGQGDIVGITDTSGNVIASYTYDYWSKLISVKGLINSNLVDITDATSSTDRQSHAGHIGHINPFNYRGYYYDSEAGLYYLNARYYAPETGRFIRVDDNWDDNLNLFAYCGNNPIMFFAPGGAKRFYTLVVLYAPDDFSRQADDEAKWLASTYNEDEKYVIKTTVKSRQEFINEWNKYFNKDDKEHIVMYLIFHGNPKHLYPDENLIVFGY